MKFSSLYRIFFTLVLLLYGAACGNITEGTPTTPTIGEPITNLSTAVTAIGSLLNFTSSSIDFCNPKAADTIECDCPKGGTITLVEGANNTGVFTFDNCRDSYGQNFIGTISYASSTLTFDFTQAGDCREISGTGNTSTCEGSLEAFCKGTTAICDFSNNTSGGCLCD